MDAAEILYWFRAVKKYNTKLKEQSER